MTNKTKRITESAMLLAVAIVLELVSKMFIPEMPFGGQITLVSMLPVVLISYRHGVKWGLIAGVAYALLEMAIGAKTVAAAFQPGYFGDGVMLLNAFGCWSIWWHLPRWVWAAASATNSTTGAFP